MNSFVFARIAPPVGWASVALTTTRSLSVFVNSSYLASADVQLYIPMTRCNGTTGTSLVGRSSLNRLTANKSGSTRRTRMTQHIHLKNQALPGPNSSRFGLSLWNDDKLKCTNVSVDATRYGVSLVMLFYLLCCFSLHYTLFFLFRLSFFWYETTFF